METRKAEQNNAQVLDKNNGSYIISFVAQQVGEMKLSVFVNGQPIKGNPLTIMVKENPVMPRKIITNHYDNFDQLMGIACSSDSTWAVVADWNKGRVCVFDSQDRLISRFGQRGNKDGQFTNPLDVAFDNNNYLYVTDSSNHRVQKFDIHGNYLLKFGGKGNDEGQLEYPVGIITYQHKVYVADLLNNRISVFQTDGKFYSIIGRQKLSKYFGIAVSINSEILVADWGNHRIYVFSIDGHYINDIILHMEIGRLELRNPCKLTTDSNGYILIVHASEHDHSISIFDRLGNCMFCIGSEGSNDGQFKYPRGIATSPNGNIYVSDSGNSRVQIFPSLVSD